MGGPRIKSGVTGSQLKEWRDTLNLTQAEVAYLMGITARQYIKIEGANNPVSKTHILAWTLIMVAADSHPTDNIDFAMINASLNALINDYFPTSNA